MSVRILQIPDAIADWPAWLERELVGIHLHELVQELEILSRGEPKTSTLEETLNGAKQAVLEQGLVALGDSQLRTLLRNPRQLTDLQELVFVAGGEYWQTVSRSDSLQRMATEQWQNLASEISDARKQNRQTIEPPPVAARTPPRSQAVRPSKELEVQDHSETRSTFFGRRTVVLIAIAALAACLLFAWIPFVRPSQDGRFFANASIQESDLTGKDYLKLMADTIRADWKLQPSGPNAARDQLVAFRDSCDILLGSDVPQLRPEVETELKARCRKWQTKFDDALNQLASGADPEQVQVEANQIVQQLLNVLPSLESAG